MIENYKNRRGICIACAGRKGGVGKSMVSTSCAYILAEKGLKVLLIDMDPQSSASQLLGVNLAMNDPLVSLKNLSVTAKELRATENDGDLVIDDLFGHPREEELARSENTGLVDLMQSVVDGYPLTRELIESCIVRPKYRVEKKKDRAARRSLEELAQPEFDYIEYGFDLLPSSEEMTDLELTLSQDDTVQKKQLIIRTIIQAIKKYSLYDAILLDCPPSLGLFTINAIEAADGSVIVGMPDEQSILSLNKLKKNFRDMKALDDDQSGILGFVLNAVDKRSPITPIIRYKVRKQLRIYCFETMIPRTASAAKANTTSLLAPMIDAKIHDAVEQLAEEIFERYESNTRWETYRKEKYNEAYQQIIADDIVINELRDIAKTKLTEDLADSGYDISALHQDRLDGALQVYLQREIRNYIRSEYDKGKLWEMPTSRFPAEGE